MSPLAAGSHISASNYLSARPTGTDSVNNSPPQVQALAVSASASRPASPLASPRMLNAKAAEFKPGPRPLSAASNRSLSRKDTASPDLWSTGMSRSTSNLAIAAPLLPDTTLLSTSWSSGAGSVPLRLPHDVEVEDDEFSPFNEPKSRNATVRASYHDGDGMWSTSSNSTGSYDTDPETAYNLYASYGPEDEYGPEQQQDGMTPLDVLSSVFGNTVAPEDLEDALARNGYDFDTTMAWLIDRRYPQADQAQHPAIRTPHSGGRVFVVPRDPRDNMIRGKSFEGSPMRKSPQPKQVQGGGGGPPNRVCRYFLAGECLRADCKFRSVLVLGSNS